MIPVSAVPQNTTPGWRHALRDAIRGLPELYALLELPPPAPDPGPEADFPLLVPRGYAARIRRGDPRDPLLLQVLPQALEQLAVAGYEADPVGDLSAEVVPGLLHKYHGRALLVTTGACAVHCRYCFRRHFPYTDSNPARNAWHDALAYLRAHSELDEIILSGGDPLMLDDDKLSALARELETIPHLRRLRLHTRIPIVLPERVDDHLLAWIERSRLQIVCVVHANHANELDGSVKHALKRMRGAGVHLLNQSVLLRGINDSTTALEALSRRLFDCGVLPYYLHALDLVAGAAHFYVDNRIALEIVRTLSERLPGYLVPKLVCEQAGMPAKTPLVQTPYQTE